MNITNAYQVLVGCIVVVGSLLDGKNPGAVDRHDQAPSTSVWAWAKYMLVCLLADGCLRVMQAFGDKAQTAGMPP